MKRRRWSKWRRDKLPTGHSGDVTPSQALEPPPIYVHLLIGGLLTSASSRPSTRTTGRMTSFLLSEQFVISAGCVLFRPKTEEICLVQSSSETSKDQWLLPKGRKNVGEPIPETAVREVLEETGCQCSLWPLKMPTRGTPPDDLGSVPDVSRVVECCEPIAIQQRRTKHGHQKLIFWYIARVRTPYLPRNAVADSEPG